MFLRFLNAKRIYKLDFRATLTQLPLLPPLAFQAGIDSAFDLMASSTKRAASPNVNDAKEHAAKRQALDKFFVTKDDVDALIEEANKGELVIFDKVLAHLEREKALWSALKDSDVDDDTEVQRAARHFHTIQSGICMSGISVLNKFVKQDGAAPGNDGGDAMDIDSDSAESVPSNVADLLEDDDPWAATEDYISALQSCKIFVKEPMVELTKEKVEQLMRTIDATSDGIPLLEQRENVGGVFLLDWDAFKDSKDIVAVMKSMLDKSRRRTQADDWSKGFELFVVMLKLLDLIQKQLDDARNAAFRKHSGSSQHSYPAEFEMKGRDLKESEKEMRARKELVSGWFRYFLTLIAPPKQHQK